MPARRKEVFKDQCGDGGHVPWKDLPASAAVSSVARLIVARIALGGISAAGVRHCFPLSLAPVGPRRAHPAAAHRGQGWRYVCHHSTQVKHRHFRWGPESRPRINSRGFHVTPTSAALSLCRRSARRGSPPQLRAHDQRAPSRHPPQCLREHYLSSKLAHQAPKMEASSPLPAPWRLFGAHHLRNTKEPPRAGWLLYV